MKPEDFVTETLVEIFNGIRTAQERVADTDARINPAEYYEDDETIKEYITLNYRNLEDAELLNQDVVRHIQAFHAHHQFVIDIWMALYPILKWLEAGKNYPDDHAFSSGVLRISSCLSLATCVAIDNMYHVITDDCQHGNHYYK